MWLGGDQAPSRDQIVLEERLMPHFNPLPSLKVVRSILHYSPSTGQWTWIKGNNRRRIKGKKAGAIDAKGYCIIGIEGKNYRAHRLAWLYMTEVDPKESEIDHIDGNPSNNSFFNLRLADQSQQKLNQKTYSCNSSGYKGLSWHRASKGWRGQITLNGKTYSKISKDKKEVVKWLEQKRIELHGSFARFN